MDFSLGKFLWVIYSAFVYSSANSYKASVLPWSLLVVSFKKKNE